MTPTRLILIEGITGSGKSTTAQRLWLHLNRHGHAARWVYEHDTTHPIWLPDEQASLVAAGSLPAGFIAEVLPARWRAFATGCAGTAEVSILESALYQSTVGFLLAMNVAAPVIAEHVMVIADAVAWLAPVLIRFRPRDVAQALGTVCEHRQVDDYAAALITHIGATPYGKAHDLCDFASLVRFYEQWSALVDTLAPRLPMRQLVIDPASGDWPARERQITDFLGLPEMRVDAVRPDRPTRYCGRYANAATGDALVVASDAQGLYIEGGRGTHLIPARGDSFHVAALCAEASFSSESDGRFMRLDLIGNLPGLNQPWRRVEGEP